MRQMHREAGCSEQARDPIPTPRGFDHHITALTAHGDSGNQFGGFTVVDIDRRHHLSIFIEHDDLGSPTMEVNTHVT